MGNTMCRRLLVVAVALAMAGCSTSRPSWLENRVAVTVDGSQAHVLSMWGPISVGSRIADADARAISEALAQRVR